MDDRLAKTIEVLKALGADFGIFTSPDAVAYVSGHIVPIEAGPSPFAGGPSVVIVSTDGTCALVATNLEAATSGWANPVIAYEGFGFQTPADIFGNYTNAVTTLARRTNLGGVIAIEAQSFPLALAPLIDGHVVIDITSALKTARAIKTQHEITALKKAAQIASIGQKAFLEHARAGNTELEAFANIRLAMESAAGERLPLTGDFISGKERTSQFMGWPGNRSISPGDPLICDLAPRVEGYWGDSCASAMVGEPSAAYLRLFHTVQSALLRAVETIKPGMIIGDLDAMLQARIHAAGYDYAHHSGHSIGTSVHEWPRLVAYETSALKTDMVIMVEPTALDEDIGGVRLEWMLYVTETGCEVLTDFEHQPQI